ncbi:uncharacterized protein [Callorhinus ursinus]|uniref:uncharacterized protein n=1 Tax=Callorhinus ursinus TaxID=34884 RepID=UPI003CD00018
MVTCGWICLQAQCCGSASRPSRPPPARGRGAASAALGRDVNTGTCRTLVTRRRRRRAHPARARAGTAPPRSPSPARERPRIGLLPSAQSPFPAAGAGSAETAGSEDGEHEMSTPNMGLELTTPRSRVKTLYRLSQPGTPDLLRIIQNICWNCLLGRTGCWSSNPLDLFPKQLRVALRMLPLLHFWSFANGNRGHICPAAFSSLSEHLEAQENAVEWSSDRQSHR